MIEHPEAVTIAGQIAATLTGKRIESAVRGNAPHKFAFYSRPADEYATILKGKTIAGAQASGSLILVRVADSHLMVLGGGGERIAYHASADSIPQKHQLLLSFTDGSSLSVKVQGWGSCQLWTPGELDSYKWYSRRSLGVTDDGFTGEHFAGLFGALKPDDARSVKFFLISEPGVWGVGNGYLQDILFRARIHPRARAVDLTGAQRRKLYGAVTQTIWRAVSLRGRTDEYDLFGNAGGYQRVLDASAAGKPCPECGDAAIVKEAFLGGSVYFCPRCQQPPPRPTPRSARPKQAR